MKNRQLGIRIVLLTALTLMVAVLLPPTSESKPPDVMYVWSYTPEAQARTAAGDCPPEQLCKELCERIDGQSHPTGQFACFPDS